MNVSFGNVFKVNLPEKNKNALDTEVVFSGFSDSTSVLGTFGHLKGDDLSSRLIGFLIGDKLDKNGESKHHFMNIDGDIYVISGADYEECANLRKGA
ncbi:hypothetical protein II906_00040, partial [bacterium]|nr:hypothetical protein [bacterium]